MTARSARILVVDDERFFREAIREVLEAEKLECVVAANGAEALEHADDPTLGVVVLDVQLPGIDGIEVLRRLRERRPDLRVLILSAHTDQEIVLEALRLGACDYLAKPLHDEELVLAVRRALDTHAVDQGWRDLRDRLGRLERRLVALAGGAADEEEADRLARLRSGVADAAAEVLGAGKTSLMLLDEDGTKLRVAAATGRKLSPEELDPVPVGEGVAGLALARNEVLLVEDVRHDPRFQARGAAGRYDSGSFAVAPIAAGDRMLGVLCATDREGGAPFEEADRAILRILALQAGQLLAPPAPNGHAAASEPPAPEVPAEGVDRDAELVRQICEAVTSEVDPARVLQAALRPIRAALDAAPVSLYLRDAESGELVCQAQEDGGLRADRARLPVGRGLTGQVLETGRLVATAEPQQDPRFEAAVDTPEGGAPAPLLCVPLRFRGRTLGVFRAFPKAGEQASPRTGELLGAALSAAVRNVLLYRSLVDTIEEVARVRREAGGRAQG